MSEQCDKTKLGVLCLRLAIIGVIFPVLLAIAFIALQDAGVIPSEGPYVGLSAVLLIVFQLLALFTGLGSRSTPPGRVGFRIAVLTLAISAGLILVALVAYGSRRSPHASPAPSHDPSSAELSVRAQCVPPKEPLHRAVQAGNIKNVQELIDQGVDVNKLDERYGCTALHMAATLGHLEIARVLRTAGARIYAENEHGEPLVFAAVYSGNVDFLRFLLDEGASSESRNRNGENLVHHAITHRREDVLLYLIDINVDVNAQDDRGWTPLHTVAWIGDLPVTSVLIDAGANMNAAANNRETPLHTAAAYNHAQVVRDLITAQANVNLLDESGRHPLFHARSVEVMGLLLDAGANPDISDRYNYTPLSGAVNAGNGVALVTSLIQSGADVNKRTDHGRTAIFNVIPDDNIEVFSILVKNGADLTIQSDSGETPLDWVLEYNAEKIRAFLEKHADPNNEQEPAR